ncbi:hypothetical protein SADUNF_Sadunf17G0012700 [Salix dunnii]|uniref:Uncharacterized protein n=1 Tax=Salix dunnii TaxID=1413687 RepID=A0A835J4Z6_9ROSI|nr:hypothetical protein SADUNF_Sadunf17G0012700 [Salix dunnii]
MALYESVTCGTLWASTKKDLADEDSESKQGRVNELILNEGAKSILKTVNFDFMFKSLSSHNWKIQLKATYGNLVPAVDGLKTIEGSCAVGDNNRQGCLFTLIMASGVAILFNKCVASEGFEKVLPEVNTIAEEEKERSNGILVACVAKSAAQPYISLARILPGLGQGGLVSLLVLSAASSMNIKRYASPDKIN